MSKTRSPRSADHPHVAAGNKYAKDVVSGKIPVCKWVFLACKRHLDDLEASKGHNFPYRFDSKAAEKWCKFLELLPHTKGEWARKGLKLKLEPWQCFKTVCLFGWLRKQDGLRRFRKALILEPRKNAKSTWAAGVGLGMMSIDGDHGAEVYSGATTEKQAWEVFKPARLMAMKTPAFVQHYGVTVGAKNIHRLGDGSKFEPLIGDPGDGASPSCAIVDEYHEHATDRMVDTMETGMGAREQPLLLIITTAGDNLSGPCYAAVQEAEKVLEGIIENDELFALIYTVDADDDWSSDLALRKANPNYDVSVKGEFLRARQRDAKQNPRKIGVFKTKHLNMWVQARNAYFDIQKWKESATPALRLEDFRGQPCKIGLDLASVIDIAAMEITFEHEGGYARFGRYYLPEATIELPENEHYRGWRDAPERWITQTDGDMIDYVTIRDDILGLQDEEGLGLIIDEIAFDPHQAHMMMAELREEGIPCIEVRPLVLNFSPAMKQMDGLIRSRKIAHNGDPVFTWMLSNVVAKADAKDNVYPRKDREQNKIDGPVAHMMCQARWMSAEAEGPSVYETRGILEIEV
ncbi:phage terminase large subunit-like protein [Aquamicrobium lusatiense]|uniref:Phage terminase large subunit-like protein n=1 Tax=Aquamicrobium lusatiense TaxID=89772 RepID=A0A7W9S0J8_9HYPH|nr:terminase TerL endonuclease subunit [Aquamicrobium lusatiense]MBB6011887.1 phage terminase large subunit-like protein [Aquamicrobium lusatiense]